MKNIYFIVLFSIITSFTFSQEWDWAHQRPQGNTLRWVKMWDANNWYAVGLSGTFMKTTDGGQSWSFHHQAGVPNEDGSTDAVYSGHFFDMNNGLVCGTAGLMKTTNGGVSFDTIGSNLPPAATWYNMYFVNSNIGFTAGTTSGQLAKTTDGGLTWERIQTATSATNYDVWSPDGNLILISSSSGNVRRSTDGGATWAVVSTGLGTPTLYKLAFKTSTEGWVVGSTGKAGYTTDGGLTWTNASTGLPTTTTFYDVDYRLNGSTEEVVLTGDSFNLYATSDNGTTWTQISHIAPVGEQPWTSTYYSSEFLGDKIVAAGAFGLVNSKVGSSTANIHTYFRKPGILYDVWAESPLGKVIAVGAPSGTAYDQVFYSTDGGVNWLKGGLTESTINTTQFVSDTQIDEKNEDEISIPIETPNSTSTFRAIDMVDGTTGYVVGTNSAIYKTTNGGLTFDSIPSPLATLVALYDVDFVDANNGWIVGASGNVWKTTDGGTSWTQQTSGGTTTLYSIYMVDASTGWFSGASGNLRKTTDGGATWEVQTSGFGTSIVYAIKMMNATEGYIVGASGKAAKTTDAGTTWNLITFPAAVGTTTLYTVDFKGNFGVIGGSSSRVLTTIDAGQTWSLEATGASTIYGVRITTSGADTSAAYHVGTNAYIKKNSLFIVPVELISFSVNVSGYDVTLNWSTATEKNNLGFDIERRSENSDYSRIGFIEGKGTTTEVSAYSFTDKSLAPGKYSYRLKQMDYDGTVEYLKEVEVNIAVPAAYSLDQNYPNPFNPVTVIKYSVPVEGNINLSVYNMLGEKIAAVVNGFSKAGNFEVNFDASKLSSGVYYYKLEAGDFSAVKKMMLIK